MKTRTKYFTYFREVTYFILPYAKLFSILALLRVIVASPEMLQLAIFYPLISTFSDANFQLHSFS